MKFCISFKISFVFSLFVKTCIIFTARIETQSVKHFTSDEIASYRERARHMFEHAYNGYLKYAYPYDELRPLTCDGHDTWGSYSLTLVDALDTLAVMGNYSEFRRVATLLARTLDFDRDINVSVFETNIRVVGGLLSAHLLSRRAGMQLEPGWPCSGPLLRLAEKAASKLLPAFDTATGMPYGTVNLRHGVPVGETSVTCTAGVGTFIVEFGALTRLTGDTRFEAAAMRALHALWDTRSEIGLVGNHIDVVTGKWTAVDAGIGAGVDSYFEYLVKGGILFQKADLMLMFQEYEIVLEKYLKRDDWFVWAQMQKGGITLPVFQSLDAYWPGLQSLTGNIDSAMKTLHNYQQVWRQYGFIPEFYNIPKSEAQTGREGYPLRPELIESIMYLFRATKDPFLMQAAVDILESIEHSTRTHCGYSTVKNVKDHKLENRMESFFLAETTKYLYLTFDPDNFIHDTGGRGSVIKTPGGECLIDAGGYVFNTEAHPLDAAALYCCSAEKHRDDAELDDLSANLDLLTLLGIGGDDLGGLFVDQNETTVERKEEEMKDGSEVEGDVHENSDKSESDETVRSDMSDVSPDSQDDSENTVPIINANELKLTADNDNSIDPQDDVDKVLSEQQDVSVFGAGSVSSGTDSLHLESTTKDIESANVDVSESTITGSVSLEGTEIPGSVSHIVAIPTSEDASQNVVSDSEVRELVVPETLTVELSDTTSQQVAPNETEVDASSQTGSLACEKSERKVQRRILACPARPFHSRLSFMGEMFPDVD